MMSPQSSDKFEELIERLIASTRAGTVRWRAGFADDSFVATLKHGTVTINRYSGHSEDATAPNQSEDCYELAVFDPSGMCGERLSSDPSRSGDDSVPFRRQPLAELFRLARASAVDLEGVVDALIGELG